MPDIKIAVLIANAKVQKQITRKQFTLHPGINSWPFLHAIMSYDVAVTGVLIGRCAVDYTYTTKSIIKSTITQPHPAVSAYIIISAGFNVTISNFRKQRDRLECFHIK